MLKNYSSSVPAVQSIAWIERRLAHHKASQILKEYDPECRVVSIAFIVLINGTKFPFKLPARVYECEKVLMARVRRPRGDTVKRVKEQAERTAWKILADWVDVQMAMIELSQVDFMEVFLSYLYDPAKKQTYFEMLKEKGFQKLLPGVILEKEKP